MRKVLLFAPVLAVLALVAQQSAIFPVLKSTVLMGKQPAGFYLVANNQLLRPWGELAPISGRPVDMTFDSQHRMLAVLDTRALLLLDPGTGAKLGEVPAHQTSYAGIAFRPGDRELWASETARNGPDAILIAPLNELGHARQAGAHRPQRPPAARRYRLLCRRQDRLRGLQPQQLAGGHRHRDPHHPRGDPHRHGAFRRRWWPAIGVYVTNRAGRRPEEQ